MMADLPGESGVLMIGGFDGPGCCPIDDMWEYEPRAAWHDVTPAILPEPGTAFAFDAGSSTAVFVDIEGNTWAYHPATNTWEPKETKGDPEAPHGASMVYDAKSDRMILFGGFAFDVGVNAETWAYDLDSNTWERMHPKRSPGPRNFSAMAYDEGSDRVILFGGAPNGGAIGDTWAYDYESDSWTEMSPEKSPPARTYSWMVYDSSRDRMILFGGSEDAETAAFPDTWTYDYDQDTWARLEVRGPSARAWHAMAFDDETGEVVLFGGGRTRDEYTSETWIYDPRANTWSLES